MYYVVPVRGTIPAGTALCHMPCITALYKPVCFFVLAGRSKSGYPINNTPFL